MSDPDFDALLGDWTTPSPSAALRERIVASARVRPRSPAAWWASAAGLGLAGALAGAVAVMILAPPVTPMSPPAQAVDVFHADVTVFGDLDDGSES